MKGSCEHGNEASAHIEGGEETEELSDSDFQERPQHGSSCLISLVSLQQQKIIYLCSGNENI
jgi:hypothetical protein